MIEVGLIAHRLGEVLGGRLHRLGARLLVLGGSLGDGGSHHRFLLLVPFILLGRSRQVDVGRGGPAECLLGDLDALLVAPPGLLGPGLRGRRPLEQALLAGRGPGLSGVVGLDDHGFL